MSFPRDRINRVESQKSSDPRTLVGPGMRESSGFGTFGHEGTEVIVVVVTC